MAILGNLSSTWLFKRVLFHIKKLDLGDELLIAKLGFEMVFLWLDSIPNSSNIIEKNLYFTKVSIINEEYVFI